MPGQRVAVVATVLNEVDSLDGLLASLRDQTRAPDQIVIVDGGSSDGTWQVLERWQGAGLPLIALRAPGSSISRGRNLAIARAASEIVAVTDAGVRLAADWLAELLAPFEASEPPDVVAGFFRADPRSIFELALGATTLPTHDEIDPARFLPSSRSVAFRWTAWQAVGGYPEWLDYCEDLVFDLALREAGYRFAWAPAALVHFRPRPSPAAFFQQYFRYARGDGKARLWTRRHAIRYATYLAAPTLLRATRAHPLALALLGAAGLAYCWRPYRRLWPNLGRLRPPERLVALGLVPGLRLVGDLAKLLGYPVGLAWRLRWHREVACRSTGQSATLRNGSAGPDQGNS